MADYLSAGAILGVEDIDYEDVAVPEWGGTVRVQAMSGTARDRFEAAMVDKNGQAKSLEGFRARLAAACLVDGAGKRLFRSEAEAKLLGEKSAQALQRVCDVAMRLSAFSGNDVEDLTKN